MTTATPEGLGDALIPVVNKLQDIFSQASLDFKLDLPQVVVIGSQSSGKSSVLESLVGRDFLPRGSEICTRRPLILQLVKLQQGNGAHAPQAEEWGEFLHLQGKKFHDFDKIRAEIQEETARLSGFNKGVSDKPIRLKIHSPHVLTMTLVDLPGLAKVPVGDQPGDIQARIRTMVFEYIRHPTCIILAVSPANADLVNSDALEMARQADPQGTRTIGVLTKLDIMDRGTEATAMLRNEVVPLRLGHIGVVNRSQHDINTQRSMAEACAGEAAFFEEHPAYLEVASQCGTPALARALNRILVDHIRAVLPHIRGRLEDALSRRVVELQVYGHTPPGHTSAQRGALLLQLLDAYAVRYSEMLEGRSEALPVSELAGGARIRHIFQDIFHQGLSSLNPSSELSEEDVRTAIKNTAGVKGTLMLPDAPFELLVRRAISRLLTPALQCKEFVHSELLRIAGQCAPPDIARFPSLQTHLVEAVEEYINTGAAPAERMIKDLVACEVSHINTDHSAFIGGSRAIAVVMERRQQAAGHRDADRDVSPSRDDHSRPPSSIGDLGEGPEAHSNGGRVPIIRNRPRGPVMDTHQAHTAARQGLKGMEPDLLYSPEELMEPARTLQQRNSPHHHQGAQRMASPGPSAVQRHPGTPQSGWFSTLFKGGPEARADYGPASELHQPPYTLRVRDSVSEQESVQVAVTRLLVESYYDIVRAGLQDSVPKAIMHFLVLFVQRGLQQHLIRTLYREELFGEMMQEREDIAAKRASCLAVMGALREALATLDTIPQTLASRINTPHKLSHDGRLLAGQGDSQPLHQMAAYGALPQRSHSYKNLGRAARMAVAALAACTLSDSDCPAPAPFGSSCMQGA
ncbi:hypothetical protein WJX73_006112 [Symbiochloris irregularis]|uniref:Uncharacterized protein n=1 Tax=Symbiochloris irregularis TaxID=706552 RepID=A0AAW1PZH7_9CHLO